MPALLIIKTLSGPCISGFNPVSHFLVLLLFLFVIHVFFTFIEMDLVKQK